MVSFARDRICLAQYLMALHGSGYWHQQQNGPPLARRAGRFAIHEYVSLLGLAFALFHALVLLGDHYINFTVAQIFMPFSTVDYRPTWVGIGQIGFYVWLIVNLSFYVRSSIGQKTWRVLHYLSFGMYIMGLLHGLFSGTDTAANWAQWYYWISGGSLLFLLIYRILNTITEKLTRRPKPSVAQVQRSTGHAD